MLKPTGSFFFHCDPHANCAIRALMQQNLGLRFQSEIVWKRSSAHSGAKRPGPVHETADAWYNNVEEKTGRRFNRDNLTAPGKRIGSSGKPWRGIDPTAKNRHWAIPGFVGHIVEGLDTLQALDKLDAAGRIHWPKKAGGTPMLKRYLDESKGVPLQDVWNDIPPLHNLAPERVGYPTQKPLALLERIIGTASNPGDTVLDAFCGCGTALVAAERLGRRWSGIDQSPTACRVVAERLARDLALADGVHFWVRDVPKDEELIRQLEPVDFQNWAVVALGGLPSPIKVGDKGIDGRLYVVNPDVPAQVQSEFVFARPPGYQFDLFRDWVPIQAKKKDKERQADRTSTCSRPRSDATRRSSIKRVRREEGMTIVPITVKEILERQAA